MRIILSLLILIICSSTINAQLKYRAKEDFGLKGNVKSFIKKEVLFSGNGDSTKEITTELSYYFSKKGELDSLKENRINGLRKLTNFYIYFVDRIIERNTLNPSFNIVYFIDSTGNVSSKTAYKAQTPVDSISLANTTSPYTLFIYDNSDKLKETKKFSAWDELIITTTRKYNHKGLLVKRFTKNDSNKLLFYSEYTYDSLDRRVSYSFYHNNKIMIRNTYSYTDTKIINFSEGFTPKYATSTSSTFSKYDNFGNLIKEKKSVLI